MIGPQDERPKEGPDALQDAVTVELCDLEHGVCALLRVVRTAGESAPSTLALACLGGETTLTGPGEVHLDVIDPLARWTARFEHADAALEVELEASSAPIDFGETAGVHRYEQLCRVRGELRARGRRTDIDGPGRRAHAWGEPAAARFRSLWAVAGDRALTLTAVRPPGAADHAQEQIAAYLVRPESEPERFQNARISTVYDASGRPRSAGLELLMPGDEYPRRATGEAVWQATADPLQAACFRWSLDGERGHGGYQVVSPA